MGLIYDNSLTAFLIVTLLLGGGAAWLTGRAGAGSLLSARTGSDASPAGVVPVGARSARVDNANRFPRMWLLRIRS